MARSRRQALIDAPLEDVWRLVGNPERYPDWAAGVIDVTGLAERVPGGEFRQTMRGPLSRPSTTTFAIDELEELREIRMRCTRSGLYSHWLLTEVRDSTFVEVEIGMQPESARSLGFDATVGRLWYRRLIEDSLAGLRKAVTKVTQRDRGPG